MLCSLVSLSPCLSFSLDDYAIVLFRSPDNTLGLMSTGYGGGGGCRAVPSSAGAAGGAAVVIVWEYK